MSRDEHSAPLAGYRSACPTSLPAKGAWLSVRKYSRVHAVPSAPEGICAAMPSYATARRVVSESCSAVSCSSQVVAAFLSLHVLHVTASSNHSCTASSCLPVWQQPRCFHLGRWAVMGVCPPGQGLAVSHRLVVGQAAACVSSHRRCIPVVGCCFDVPYGRCRPPLTPSTGSVGFWRAGRLHRHVCRQAGCSMWRHAAAASHHTLRSVTGQAALCCIRRARVSC